MRLAPVSLASAAACVLLAAVPAASQQGSVQVSAATQATTGETLRGANLDRVEPDFGVTWLQPKTRAGTIQVEFRGTERGNELHPGRMYGALRDLDYRGLRWTFEGGDTYYTPTISDYKFSNLYAPAVTFSGAAVAARSTTTEIGVVAGRATVWRNIFGTDPDTLDQTILGARLLRHAGERLDVNARVSRVRTGDLAEFNDSIAATDQAGGGMRVVITPELQVVADGGIVRYRRAASSPTERDGSGVAGLHWLHSRGWLQINVSRFSPGESPTINSPLPDRAGRFAAGEFDVFRRLRAFAGWEAFRSNLDPSAALAAGLYQLPRTSGTRQFGGVRAQVSERSTVSFRVESGDRISKYVTGRQDIQSDTGLWSIDWHAALRKTDGFLRLSQRSNVTSASRSGSYDQRDLSGQLFLRLSQSSQIFGLATVTTTIDEAGGGNTFWQAGGGAQLQVVRQGLWMRTEATLSRNTDLLTQLFMPRESLSLGLNGYVTSRTSLGVDVYLDRAPLSNGTSSPWATRSIVRVVQTIPTGAPFSAANAGLFRNVPLRALATVKGTVFADWNGNGLREPDEDPVSGVPMRLAAVGATETSKSGEFVFKNVPDGIHDVGVDLGALPIDYDPPSIPKIQVALSGHDTRLVAFGLVPLGSIRGRVVRDLNGNGTADSSEPALDGVVVVLDGGKRSERSKRGQFAFEAVPSGDHTLTLLAESLPDNATIAGDVTRVARLERGHMAIDLPFVVSIEARGEIRKVFPGNAAATRVAGRTPRDLKLTRTPVVAPSDPAATHVVSPAAIARFTLQVAAFDDPERARGMAAALTSKGLDAYVVEPPPTDRNAPYRVRIGRYDKRADAERAAKDVKKVAGEKVWIADGSR